MLKILSEYLSDTANDEMGWKYVHDLLQDSLRISDLGLNSQLAFGSDFLRTFLTSAANSANGSIMSLIGVDQTQHFFRHGNTDDFSGTPVV